MKMHQNHLKDATPVPNTFPDMFMHVSVCQRCQVGASTSEAAVPQDAEKAIVTSGDCLWFSADLSMYQHDSNLIRTTRERQERSNEVNIGQYWTYLSEIIWTYLIIASQNRKEVRITTCNNMQQISTDENVSELLQRCYPCSRYIPYMPMQLHSLCMPVRANAARWKFQCLRQPPQNAQKRPWW